MTTLLKVDYTSNNSGGGWWLNDEDWLALEKAGWDVSWGPTLFCKDRFGIASAYGVPAPAVCTGAKVCPGHQVAQSYDDIRENDKLRFLRAAATRASKHFESLAAGIQEWEEITKKDSSALGCYDCCGAPHSFEAYDPDDEGARVESYYPTPRPAARYGDL